MTRHPSLLRWATLLTVLLGSIQPSHAEPTGTPQPAAPGAAASAATNPVLASLPLSDALVRRHGTGSHWVAVFADPYCPYCRQLEADLHRLPNLTIYTFLIPVLQPDSANKSRSIWCAADPAKAWQDWMLSGRSAPPAPTGCDQGVLTRNLALAQRLGFRGTPAMVFADGRQAVGGMAPEALAARISAAAR
ncbi:MAG: hypothetical protein CFE45_07255 [Burkholderiales bacterium PBB5]|nr:MAG: hypothetical protein CFE45_07255 [Burkholderiales bacterium PBB5]